MATPRYSGYFRIVSSVVHPLRSHMAKCQVVKNFSNGEDNLDAEC